jgi:hypothetical protein
VIALVFAAAATRVAGARGVAFATGAAGLGFAATCFDGALRAWIIGFGADPFLT